MNLKNIVYHLTHPGITWAKIRYYSKDTLGFRSYSQFGEDVMLRGFFLGDKWSWKPYHGFWVDIGAHHPTRQSNTKFYSKAGWRGINVDASTDAIKLFNRQRKRDINVNVGIGKTEGNLDYFRMSSPLLNTFSKAFADKAIAAGDARLIEAVKVPVITLKTLLDKYLPSGQEIDFMSIDCEGLDLEILESNDWSLYRPEYILIEIHMGGENWEVQSTPAARFLKEHGYELVGQCICTSLFKRVRDR